MAAIWYYGSEKLAPIKNVMLWQCVAYEKKSGAFVRNIHIILVKPSYVSYIHFIDVLAVLVFLRGYYQCI